MSTTSDVRADAPARRRVREGLTPAWWAALFAVPLVLAVLSAMFLHAHVEDNLRQRVQRSILGAGATVTSVDVDGRDVTAHVPTNSSRATMDSLAARLRHVEGVRDVTVTR